MIMTHRRYAARRPESCIVPSPMSSTPAQDIVEYLYRVGIDNSVLRHRSCTQSHSPPTRHSLSDRVEGNSNTSSHLHRAQSRLRKLLRPGLTSSSLHALATEPLATIYSHRKAILPKSSRETSALNLAHGHSPPNRPPVRRDVPTQQIIIADIHLINKTSLPVYSHHSSETNASSLPVLAVPQT
ncbi:hypothetical protein NHX12_003600 [Muraenolepis orangiensis]|uniref:Uncharacterized protein n=1 Tax=Muraenolepis orangiensis TaxID=630683 RepID=A0A9Q0E1Q4_9TELE|nr:hypothetical protein NHX12_003600 [Muraenolepis orangiensis]